MNILVVGKFPPIEGGVSAQTFHLAHKLAERGHHVFVVTNAKEVEPDYRIFMRPDDWGRCETQYPNGSVRVFWTDPSDSSMTHIPSHNPFFTKLASLGLEVAQTYSIDVVFSFYLEPYGVAGDMIAREIRVPHVVKTAGSDAGYLWRHRQLRPVYDAVFRRAAKIWTGLRTRDELVNRCGIPEQRIESLGQLAIPADLFCPDGAALDLEACCAEIRAAPGWGEEFVFGKPQGDRRYFGIYGKIAENKGIFDLLEALARLRAGSLNTGLLIMGGGEPHKVAALRERATHLGMGEAVVQLPPLPYWRVPEFIRRCFAVCCLERDFPISIHNPVIAREVMLSGTCLVASTEVLGKLSRPERLVNGYNCIAVPDVHDHDGLAQIMEAMLREPAHAAEVGARAREYVLGGLQADGIGALEALLGRALDSNAASRTSSTIREVPPLVRFARKLRERVRRDLPEISVFAPIAHAHPAPEFSEDLEYLREILRRLGDCAADSEQLGPYRAMAFLCRRIMELPPRSAGLVNPGFLASLSRLQCETWAVGGGEFARLDAAQLTAVGGIEILQLDYDANQILAAMKNGNLPSRLSRTPSFVAIQHDAAGTGSRVLAVDAISAALLHRCGARLHGSSITGNPRLDTAALVNRRTTDTVRKLFEEGLIGLKFNDSAEAAD